MEDVQTRDQVFLEEGGQRTVLTGILWQSQCYHRIEVCQAILDLST